MNKGLLLAAIIMITVLLVWLLWIMLRPEFFRELQFLKMEISRTTGEERKKWLRQRKRLLLSLIPFVKYKK